MLFSRRDLLRFGSTAFLCSAALPVAKLAHEFMLPPPARRKARYVEVHFTGKHAFARILDKAACEGWSSLPMGELVGRVGTFMLDTPYVNHTLDHSGDSEFCIVNLQELDCVTFVEMSLALARMIKSGESGESDLAKQIELLRYRHGECDGFCSRLHYLSDWFYDNGKKDLIKPYAKELPGAVKMEKEVSLMSSRPQQYLQLRKHPEWIPEIRKDEKAISSRPIYYIPKSKVKSSEQYMETGDVVGITTEAKILDCAHTGLCYRDENGVLRFLHASFTHRRVYLDTELSEYLDKIHAFTGIMLARPLEPVDS